MSGYYKIIGRLPILIPRARAGDPSAIAMLAAAGIMTVSIAMKDKKH